MDDAEQTPAKALVIEDDEATRKVLAALLENLEFTVHACADVIEGLQLLAEHKDMTVAFVDLNLEPFSGYAFLRALGREAAYSELKSIMVTSEAKKEAVRAAIQDGARSYLLKPVKNEQLIACLVDMEVPFKGTSNEAAVEQKEGEASEDQAAEEADASAAE